MTQDHQAMRIAFSSPIRPGDLRDLIDSKHYKVLEKISGSNATPVTPLILDLHRLGHEIEIFSLDSSISQPISMNGERITIQLFPRRRARRYMVDCYRRERHYISQAILQARPDIISAQWSYEYALAALDTGMPTFVTCHDTPLRYAWISKSIHMTYHLLLAFEVIRKASHIVAVSPYTDQHIRRYFRPTAPIDVIPNGLPDEWLQPKRNHTTTKSDTKQPYTIVSISNWGRLKNISNLMRAHRILIKKGHSIRLVLYGSGLEEGGPAHRWAKRKNCDTGVEFMGSQNRSNLRDFLIHHADLMVHPSRIETHGMVLIEAMACGVPVVGGLDCGAVPWTLEDGKSGILCDINSPQAISDCIAHAMNHPEEMTSLASHALCSVKKRFSIGQVAKAHEKMFLKSLAVMK